MGHKSGEITTHYSLADIARLMEFVERITVRKQTFMLRPVRGPVAFQADSRIRNAESQLGDAYKTASPAATD